MKCTLYNWKSESLINLNLTADSIHFCILRIIFLSFVHLEILYIWMAWYYFHSTENPTYSSKSRSRFIFWKAPLWRWVHANVFFFFFLNDLGNFLSPPFSFFYFLKIIWFIFYCAGFSFQDEGMVLTSAGWKMHRIVHSRPCLASYVAGTQSNSLVRQNGGTCKTP